MTTARLIMLMPYCGRWPASIEFFIESCKRNPAVRWRFYTDCGAPENEAANVEYVQVSFADYKAQVRARLGSAFDPADPYKLCDLKPCLGHVHAAEIAGFTHFGYGDIDVIYGDIGAVYGDALLRAHDLISSSDRFVAEHFAVLGNTATMREAFMRLPDWRAKLAAPALLRFDEDDFTLLFRGRDERGRADPAGRVEPINCRTLFVERFSTVLSPRKWHDATMDYPRRWFWKDGRLTNERDGAREFLYLHFMRWKSDRWMAYPVAPGEGVWLTLPRIVNLDWRRAAAEGFCISPAGIGPLPGSRSDTHE